MKAIGDENVRFETKPNDSNLMLEQASSNGGAEI